MTDRPSTMPSLIPLSRTEFAVGIPTPRPIYDKRGKLLLDSGVLIETQHQLNGLLDQGYELKCAENTKNLASNETDSFNIDANDNVSHLDDVRWYVGEPLHMHSQAPPETHSRFIVRLIGYVKGKSVLVTAPFVDGKYVQIHDGQSFIIRVFQRKKAYSFTVTALKSVYSPHPYLHLSYPKHMVSSVIRLDARAKIDITASIAFNNPPRTEAITLTDMSIGGASGLIKQPLAKTEETGIITFKINITGYDELLSALVAIRSVTPEENDTGFRYGFEFLNLPPQYKVILSTFVHQSTTALEQHP